jgi:hypothetical protein
MERTGQCRNRRTCCTAPLVFGIAFRILGIGIVVVHASLRFCSIVPLDLILPVSSWALVVLLMSSPLFLLFVCVRTYILVYQNSLSNIYFLSDTLLWGVCSQCDYSISESNSQY